MHHHNDNETPRGERLLRCPDVKPRVGFSRSHVNAMIRQGRFPKSIVIGPRLVAWLESDIDERIGRSR